MPPNRPPLKRPRRSRPLPNNKLLPRRLLPRKPLGIRLRQTAVEYAAEQAAAEKAAEQQAAEQQAVPVEQTVPEETTAVQEPVEQTTPEPAPAPDSAPEPAPDPAETVSDPVSSSGGSCGDTFGGVQPYVAEVGCAIRAQFGLQTIYGYRAGDPGDHGTGRALDNMVYDDAALGDQIADYLLANQSDFGVNYVIWQQRINFGSGWQPMEDRGSITANHYDHVHVSFY